MNNTVIKGNEMRSLGQSMIAVKIKGLDVNKYMENTYID